MFEVPQLLEQRLPARAGGRECLPRFVQESGDVARFEQITPGFGRFGFLAPEDLRDGGQMLIGVEQVHDMDGLGKMSLGNGAVVTGAVGEHDDLLGLGQAPS